MCYCLLHYWHRVRKAYFSGHDDITFENLANKCCFMDTCLQTNDNIEYIFHYNFYEFKVLCFLVRLLCLLVLILLYYWIKRLVRPLHLRELSVLGTIIIFAFHLIYIRSYELFTAYVLNIIKRGFTNFILSAQNTILKLRYTLYKYSYMIYFCFQDSDRNDGLISTNLTFTFLRLNHF